MPNSGSSARSTRAANARAIEAAVHAERVRWTARLVAQQQEGRELRRQLLRAWAIIADLLAELATRPEPPRAADDAAQTQPERVSGH